MSLSVLYVWDADYPWDIRTEKICRALTERGHRVHIAARNRRNRPAREVLAEGTVLRLPTLRYLPAFWNDASGFPAFFNPRWHRLIRRSLRESGAEVLVVRDLPLCPAAIAVGHRMGIPVVLDMAENYPAMIQAIWDAGRERWWDLAVRNPRVVSAVERACLRRVDRVLVVVEESAERLIRLGFPADRISIVSNTPSRDRAGTCPGPSRTLGPDEPLDIVYLGLMEVPRGVGELLDATASLLSQGVPVRLTLIGDGRDRHLFEERARGLGLDGEGVRFLGQVANAEALRIVAEADVGVVPHHADEAWNTTIPNKLFDYMAAGLPVVSSDAIPCRRILELTGAGLVYRSGDAGSLMNALRALRDDAMRARLGEAGRIAVRDSYNWEHAVGELERCLVQVAGQHG